MAFHKQGSKEIPIDRDELWRNRRVFTVNRFPIKAKSRAQGRESMHEYSTRDLVSTMRQPGRKAKAQWLWDVTFSILFFSPSFSS